MKILVVQHEDGTGPGIVGAALEADGLRLDVRHPWASGPRADAPPSDRPRPDGPGPDGALPDSLTGSLTASLPASLSGHDALLVLGGAPNCEDDAAAPWFPAVRALIREAVADEVPFLGVCLGAQLAASCLGGTVVRRTRPPELGAVPLRRRPAADGDPVFDAVPDGAWAAQWHWDEIAVLPPGAVPLLTGDDCVHQAFRLGPAAWAVQFHPEVLHADVVAWAASDGPAARAAGADPDAALASLRAAEPALRAVWTATARAWGAVIRARAAAAR